MTFQKWFKQLDPVVANSLNRVVAEWIWNSAQMDVYSIILGQSQKPPVIKVEQPEKEVKPSSVLPSNIKVTDTIDM